MIIAGNNKDLEVLSMERIFIFLKKSCRGESF